MCAGEIHSTVVDVPSCTVAVVVVRATAVGALVVVGAVGVVVAKE